MKEVGQMGAAPLLCQYVSLERKSTNFSFLPHYIDLRHCKQKNEKAFGSLYGISPVRIAEVAIHRPGL